MKKSSLYTKKGDKGFTKLLDGSDAMKSDPLLSLYGDVDELNSFIGFAVSFFPKNENKDLLKVIQESLFILGSQLACPPEKRLEYNLSCLDESIIIRLEKKIDQLDLELPPLKNFILPSGSSIASCLHLCRVISRKLERNICSYGKSHPDFLPQYTIPFLNRLSDYFFVLARYFNQKDNIKEITWPNN